jgi:hypothetical protein
LPFQQLASQALGGALIVLVLDQHVEQPRSVGRLPKAKAWRR